MTDTGDPRRLPASWRAAIAIAGAVALGLLALTPLTTLWDRDETLYARIAVEMMQSGEWRIPSFGGEPFLEKPPLFYALMAMSMRVFGVSEFAARCWSPIALAATALIVFRFAGRFLSTTGGLWAMAILVLNPMAWLQGLAATTDALLLVAVTLSITEGAWVMADGPHPGRLAAIAVSCAAGTLTKGPLALALPVVVLAPVALFSATPRARARFVPVLGALLAGGLAYAAWAAWLDAHTDGAWRARFYVDSWLRLFAPLQGHGGLRVLGLPFYLATIAVGFAPWALWLWRGARELAASRRRDVVLLLASWVLVPLFGYSLIATRLPHYMLPLWPALALIAAAGVTGAGPCRQTAADRVLTGLAQPILGGGLAIALAVLAWLLPLPGARAAALAASLATAGGAAWTWLALKNHDASAGALRAAVAALVVLVLLAAWLAPALGPLKVSPRVAAAVREHAGPEIPVAAFDYADQGLDFYLGQPVQRLGRGEDVSEWIARPAPGMLLITDAAAPAVPALASRTRERSRVSGFDHSKGRFIVVRVLSREP